MDCGAPVGGSTQSEMERLQRAQLAAPVWKSSTRHPSDGKALAAAAPRRTRLDGSSSSGCTVQPWSHQLFAVCTVHTVQPAAVL